jgi:Predicted signaling protein consisting of a modified GGDEF domain and a DHH domain
MNIFKKFFDPLKKSSRNPLYIRLIVNVFISLLFFTVFVFLFAGDSKTSVRGALITTILYIITLIITGVIHRFLTIKIPSVSVDDISPMLSNITLDLMVKFYMPSVICDENDKIVWYNRALINKLNIRESMYGKNLKVICGLSSEEISATDNETGIDTLLNDRFFNIKGYMLSSQQKRYFITVWNDSTELNKAYKRLRDEDIVIAYIVIDNLDEMMQFLQDKSRTASADVLLRLRQWSNSVGGILKEYERDKFIFMCESSNMENFIAAKFDILDRIRDVRLGEGSLPVTVSMGFASIEGTLAEKEITARSALDMALQRGGDQVVVKTAEGMEFYGGRSKTVQKRTSVKARVVANELIMLMSRSSNVLVMGHKYADFDAVGACLGVARLALFCGAKVNVVSNTKDPNLTKCFKKTLNIPEYKQSKILIDSAEAQDLITSETLLVIVDVNNSKQFESIEVANSVYKTVIIDHHRKTAEFKDEPAISYIEPSASSTCELISEILEQVLPQGLLHKDEAEIMFAGILLDTMQFSRDTGVRTFSAALYLRSEGANPVEAQSLFEISMDEFKREAKFQTNVTTYRGVIAITVNDADDNTSMDRIAAAKAADKLLKVDNITASFALCRIGNIIYISARSTGTVNVQIIVEKLGGGGHFAVAATQVENSNMTDALFRLKNAIDEYINETKII